MGRACDAQPQSLSPVNPTYRKVIFAPFTFVVEIRNMASLPCHFTFRHPIFGSKKSPSDKWKNSVYYLWWEFLRRHEGYKKACQIGGNDEYARLYADFGNVHDVTFKEWWTMGDRGARLFAELSLPSSLLIEPDDIEQLLPAWQSGGVLFFVIPLMLPKLFIRKRFDEILSKRHTRSRGQRTFRQSRAHYPIKSQFSMHSLKKALQAYDLRVEKPDLTLWQIAQELRLGTTLRKEELAADVKDGEITRKKSILSVAASKKLKLARKIIDGVGRGVFPAF